MIHVRQYRPAFFEGFTNEEADVDSLEELLALEFVRRWASAPGFSRFSLSHPCRDEAWYNLMAEMDHNTHWWVVAILQGEPDDPVLVALPKWEYPG